jgi:phosphoesterase RecJ-like protein
LYYQRRASATAELIAELLDELRIVIDAEIATALLLGLYTDTGGFQHSNTSAKALQLASRLVRYGGDIFTISSQLQRSQSVNQAHLWGEILAGIEINCYGLATARVSRALLARTNSSATDVLGLVNVLALASEATAALVLVEDDSGWHGSLRTRHAHIDVGELARRLGGRGHRKAAGFLATFG